MTILSKSIYIFMQPQSKFLQHSSQKGKKPKIHTELQKTLDSISNPEQREQCWKDYHARFEYRLQSYSNKNSLCWHKSIDRDQ